jgi:hypothetical protein
VREIADRVRCSHDDEALGGNGPRRGALQADGGRTGYGALRSVWGDDADTQLDAGIGIIVTVAGNS